MISISRVRDSATLSRSIGRVVTACSSSLPGPGLRVARRRFLSALPLVELALVAQQPEHTGAKAKRGPDQHKDGCGFVVRVDAETDSDRDRQCENRLEPGLITPRESLHPIALSEAPHLSWTFRFGRSDANARTFP